MNPHGLGTDVVEIPRFRAVLERRPAIVGRLFTESEQALAGERSDGVPALAVRFAAKESVMKALGVGIGAIRFTDIEITRALDGPPMVALHGAAAELAAARGVTGWMCSLSHGDDVAVATVLALG
ncbi:MAG: holo-ACP synthase [Acidimicrobiia bacterium]